ncbi:MAG: hypothetical protein R2838_17620 [Caldilineaceae bacterium]
MRRIDPHDNRIGPAWRALLMAACVVLAQFQAWQPVQAQAQSNISSPSAGSTVSGDVPVMGTATIDPFQKYELHYKLEPSGDDAFIYFDGGTSPVVNGQLGIWRASGLPSGTYTLRLRVVKLDGNYAEFFSPNLSVNQGPAPTPTSDQPTPTPIPTATFTPAPQPTPEVGQVEQPEGVAAPANPLVPTPTPSPTPGAIAGVVGDTGSGAEEAAAVADENSLGRQLGEALGIDRLRQSFFTGVRYAATLFILLGLIYAGRRLFTWVRTRA